MSFAGLRSTVAIGATCRACRGDALGSEGVWSVFLEHELFVPAEVHRRAVMSGIRRPWADGDDDDRLAAGAGPGVGVEAGARLPDSFPAGGGLAVGQVRCVEDALDSSTRELWHAWQASMARRRDRPGAEGMSAAGIAAAAGDDGGAGGAADGPDGGAADAARVAGDAAALRADVDVGAAIGGAETDDRVTAAWACVHGTTGLLLSGIEAKVHAMRTFAGHRDAETALADVITAAALALLPGIDRLERAVYPSSRVLVCTGAIAETAALVRTLAGSAPGDTSDGRIAAVRRAIRKLMGSMADAQAALQGANASRWLEASAVASALGDELAGALTLLIPGQGLVYGLPKPHAELACHVVLGRALARMTADEVVEAVKGLPAWSTEQWRAGLRGAMAACHEQLDDSTWFSSHGMTLRSLQVARARLVGEGGALRSDALLGMCIEAARGGDRSALSRGATSIGDRPAASRRADEEPVSVDTAAPLRAHGGMLRFRVGDGPASSGAVAPSRRVLSTLALEASELRRAHRDGARFNAVGAGRGARLSVTSLACTGAMFLLAVVTVGYTLEPVGSVWVDACAGRVMARAGAMTPAELVAWACSIPDAESGDVRDAVGVGCNVLFSSSPPAITPGSATVQASVRGLPLLVCGSVPTLEFRRSSGAMPVASDVHALAASLAALLLVVLALPSSVALAALWLCPAAVPGERPPTRWVRWSGLGQALAGVPMQCVSPARGSMSFIACSLVSRVLAWSVVCIAVAVACSLWQYENQSGGPAAAAVAWGVAMVWIGAAAGSSSECYHRLCDAGPRQQPADEADTADEAWRDTFARGCQPAVAATLVVVGLGLLLWGAGLASTHGVEGLGWPPAPVSEDLASGREASPLERASWVYAAVAWVVIWAAMVRAVLARVWHDEAMLAGLAVIAFVYGALLGSLSVSFALAAADPRNAPRISHDIGIVVSLVCLAITGLASAPAILLVTLGLWGTDASAGTNLAAMPAVMVWPSTLRGIGTPAVLERVLKRLHG